MFEKLAEVEDRYNQLEAQLCRPEVCADIALCAKIMKEIKSLEPVVQVYRKYVQAVNDGLEARAMLEESELDRESQRLLLEELDEADRRTEDLSRQLSEILRPHDPLDDKDVIMEIRGGAGGEESALFASDLFRMYSMYAENAGFKTEILSINETGLGGIKEITFSVSGSGAYSRLKYESGVHRVQRVPVTDSQGKIQTSTATVAVLPQAEEVDVTIDPADLKIDTYRSSGAGGQHINKTESAIRITHLPTGIVVECQDERSQYKNKDRAMKILRSRVLDLERQKQQSQIASERRAQVGTGDRSERIRTYNFPQGRVSDHRIGLTLYKIDAIMNGDLNELLDAVSSYFTAEKMGNGEDVNNG